MFSFEKIFTNSSHDPHDCGSMPFGKNKKRKLNKLKGWVLGLIRTFTDSLKNKIHLSIYPIDRGVISGVEVQFSNFSFITYSLIPDILENSSMVASHFSLSCNHCF